VSCTNLAKPVSGAPTAQIAGIAARIAEIVQTPPWRPDLNLSYRFVSRYHNGVTRGLFQVLLIFGIKATSQTTIAERFVTTSSGTTVDEQ
jgi:hypothetical protein